MRDKPEIERDLYWSFGEYNFEKVRARKFRGFIFGLLIFGIVVFLVGLPIDAGEASGLVMPMMLIAVIYWNARRSYNQLNQLVIDQTGLRVQPLGLFIPISRIKSIDRVHGGKPFLKVVLTSPMVLLYFGLWATGKELRIAVE